MSKRRRNRNRKFVWFLIFLAVLVGCFQIFRASRRTPPRPSVARPPASQNFPQPPHSPPSLPPKVTNFPQWPTTPPSRRSADSNASPPQNLTNNGSNSAPTSHPPSEPRPAQTSATNAPAIPLDTTSHGFPRIATNALEIQVALVNSAVSPGSIDGKRGGQTASALRAFQAQQGIQVTGWLDKATTENLRLVRPALRTLYVSDEDIAALRPLPTSWLAKSGQVRLGYQTILEFAAETSFASPPLIRSLNPTVDWAHPYPGLCIIVPDAAYPTPRRAARARVSLTAHTLEAFDEFGVLLAHFPCSIARLAEKRPVGELHVTSAIKFPNYTFDPAVFPESAEARELGRRLIIPPGPNNPVGVAWIGLDRPGYGIHGTPNPEEVGRTESHGCFRLANWNADYFRRMTWLGMPVEVEP